MSDLTSWELRIATDEAEAKKNWEKFRELRKERERRDNVKEARETKQFYDRAAIYREEFCKWVEEYRAWREEQKTLCVRLLPCCFRCPAPEAPSVPQKYRFDAFYDYDMTEFEGYY